MNRTQQFINKITPRFIKQAVIKDYNSNFASWIGRTFFGIENSTLETNENIFSVVSRISNTLSSLPFKMFKDYKQENNQEVDKLLYYPNPNQTLDEIINILEVSRNTTGNGYAVIFRDLRLKLDKLVPIRSSAVMPVLEQNTKELWYQVTNEGKTYYIHNSDMIHVKHIMGNGNYHGISPIAVLKNSNEFDKAVREFSLKEMQSIRDSFILKYDTNVDEEKKVEIVKNFKNFYDENGGILFEESGVTIEKMDRKFIPGDIQITENITRDRIANVYNIPNTFLNASGGSYSSNEQLMQLFVNMTLTPIVKQYEREFNKKLLQKEQRVEGYYYKFNLNGLLRGDSKSRKDFYHGAIRDGWMSIDEVRMLEELPPKGSHAAELWISGDMYLLEMDPRERRSNPNKQKEADVIVDD